MIRRLALFIILLPALLVALPPAGMPAASAAAVAAYACAPPIAPDAAAASSELQTSYANWKSVYLTANGTGGYLRVQRPENDYDTVSEGIGYGMLIAAGLNDRATFDGLWNYAKSYFESHFGEVNDLMIWHIDKDGNPIPNPPNVPVRFNSATDADEDMAFALVLADTKWGGYTADARALIGNIMAHEVEANTWVLKPADNFGGSNITNPSYYATGYYRAFREYTGDTRWDGVINAAYGVIATVNAVNADANATGLLPDWTTAQGGPTSLSYQYTYDATRIPWRLAQDAVWHCDARASAQINKMSAFFKRIGPGNILDGYKLDGTVIGQYHNAAFVGTAAAGSIASPDAAYKTAMWNETVRLHDGTYYNDSLRLLTILFMSGGVPDPFGPNPAPTSTTIADFETGQPGNWAANPSPSSTASASITAPGYNSNNALTFSYTIGANGSAELDDFLTTAQGWVAHDWSKYQAISFAFKGNGTPATYQLQLLGQAGQTAGRATYQFTDSSTAWHTIAVPFSAFSPTPSLSQVFGLAFVPQTTGSGSFTLDQLTLHTDAPAAFAFPGGSVTRQSQPNNMVALTATPAANYRFAGWTQDGVDTGNSSTTFTVPMQDDHSVVARFLPIAYALNVSATAGGSAQVSPATGPYYFGAAVTLRAIATSGYRFAGWTINGVAGGTANPLNLTVTGDQTIVANFAPLPPPGGVTLVPASGGTVAVQSAGATATITAMPYAGYLFTGWTVDGQFVGWPNPLTLSLTTNHIVAPAFAVYFAFPDVSPADPNYTAITQLSARGIIRGYENGNFGPADITVRAQMAAMIVRALGWEGQVVPNPFPDQGPVDPALWNDVAILAAHGVAQGYPDGTFRPTGDVLHAQTISFITRAMVAQGYWQPATSDDPRIYPNVPLSSGHRLDLVTFVQNAGPIPDRPASQSWADWNTPASRGWFARVFWQALDSYFGQ